ncbi:hypothetical protein CsSME_00025807 [Camellia sinensis var. sinensis]
MTVGFNHFWKKLYKILTRPWRMTKKCFSFRKKILEKYFTMYKISH